MITIRRTGPTIADVIRDLQGVRTSVIPYAAAAALTKSAQRAQQSVVAEMRRSFRNPVAYTLGATRIEPATKDKFEARVAVKDQAGGRGTRPESYLLPEVEGGGRNEKGFERALRLAGLLASGERAMPAAGVQRDAAGNVSGATVRSVLRQAVRAGSGKRSAKLGVFVGTFGRKQTRGIWERRDGGVKPLFIFTRTLPTYSPRLDFTGVVEKSVRENFASDFYAFAKAIQSRTA